MFYEPRILLLAPTYESADHGVVVRMKRGKYPPTRPGRFLSDMTLLNNEDGLSRFCEIPGCQKANYPSSNNDVRRRLDVLSHAFD